MYTLRFVIWTCCLSHCARMRSSRRIVTRCRFTNWPVRCERGAEPCIFLVPIWLPFAGHVVLFWSWLSARGRWTALVDSEIQRKICEMLGTLVWKGYLVEALSRSCTPEQTWRPGVYVCRLGAENPRVSKECTPWSTTSRAENEQLSMRVTRGLWLCQLSLKFRPFCQYQ